VTLVEVMHPRINRPALSWTLSRIVVVPVSEDLAHEAAAILGDAGRHGHRHAVDAIVCATALASPGPVTVLTSDPDDLLVLTTGRIAVVRV
jgi:predicted nucleic acid-binding protein